MDEISMVSLVTISRTVAGWTNVFLGLGVLTLAIRLAGSMRQVARDAAMDAVQVYAAWRQAGIDARRGQADVIHYQERLRLLESEAIDMLRSQRKQLSAELEDTNGSD